MCVCINGYICLQIHTHTDTETEPDTDRDMQIEAERVVFIESLNSFVINILQVRSDPANWSSLLSAAYKRGQFKPLGRKYIKVN